MYTCKKRLRKHASFLKQNTTLWLLHIYFISAKKEERRVECWWADEYAEKIFTALGNSFFQCCLSIGYMYLSVPLLRVSTHKLRFFFKNSQDELPSTFVLCKLYQHLTFRTAQWWIQGGRTRRDPPHKVPNSFVLTYINFMKRSRVGSWRPPPLRGWRPSCGKSWFRHCWIINLIGSSLVC